MSNGISFPGWLRQFADDTDNGSVTRAAARGAYYTYLGLWHTATSRWPLGTNVFERDWDALIILDACRVDALRAVSDEYDFIESVDSLRSVGSTSHEWVAKTFTTEWQEEIAKTTYVTGNGHLNLTAESGVYPPSGGVAPFGWPQWNTVDIDDFDSVEYVWKDGGVGDLSTVPAHVVTDRAIQRGRETDQDRTIIHYMQPHGPYIPDAIDGRQLKENPTDHVINFRDMVKDGTSKQVIWERYLDNLRLVLDEVAILLENLDADKVAISSDHGELLGEFGLAGHPDGFPFTPVRRVPWTVTSATDTETHDPTIVRSDVDADVRDHLQELGYVV